MRTTIYVAVVSGAVFATGCCNWTVANDVATVGYNQIELAELKVEECGRDADPQACADAKKRLGEARKNNETLAGSACTPVSDDAAVARVEYQTAEGSLDKCAQEKDAEACKAAAEQVAKLRSQMAGFKELTDGKK